jgi:uncharacterized Zn-binding protein involved in type VI secretion
MPGAAALGDPHVCAMHGAPGPIGVTTCNTVLVQDRPAARMLDIALCPLAPAPIVLGAPTVLVGNLPFARQGDVTAHGGQIIQGSPTVLVGDGASGSGGGGGVAASAGAGAPSWTEELGAELWATVAEADPSLAEAWQQACAADVGPSFVDPGAGAAGDFARFTVAWSHADPRRSIESARALFLAFPNRYRALDARFPNGLPAPEPAGDAGNPDDNADSLPEVELENR